jgi:hypothetical protein
LLHIEFVGPLIQKGYHYVKQIAQVKRDLQPNESNLSVWRLAIEHIQKKSSRALEPRIVVLIAVLCRYAAWSSSSCGVERNFFKAMWAIESRKAWLSDGLYNDELKILCDVGEADEASLTVNAREIWVTMAYGVQKGSYATRLDKGIKRKRHAEKKSLQAWAKRRRASVAAMLNDVGVARETARVVSKIRPGGRHWDASLDKEVCAR